MKKILSITLALCCILATTINAYASEVYGDGQASTTITYTSPSEYRVYIPETLDLTEGSYSFTASMMDIAENERVIISITNLDSQNRLSLSCGQERNGSAVIYDNETGFVLTNNSPVAIFTSGCLTSTKSISLSDVQTSSAGTYSGIAEFAISLQ